MTETTGFLMPPFRRSGDSELVSTALPVPGKKSDYYFICFEGVSVSLICRWPELGGRAPLLNRFHLECYESSARRDVVRWRDRSRNKLLNGPPSDWTADFLKDLPPDVMNEKTLLEMTKAMENFLPFLKVMES